MLKIMVFMMMSLTFIILSLGLSLGEFASFNPAHAAPIAQNADAGAPTHFTNSSIGRGEPSTVFTLTSPDFREGEVLKPEFSYNGFGCTGKNLAPILNWDHAPSETKYFALTVYDPDAPTGSGWWHWLVVNIPKEATGLDAAKLPEGAVTTQNDYGATSYGGPCPPVGDKSHRYIFTLYALKDKVAVNDVHVPAAQIGYQINQLKIAQAQIIGYYGR